MKEWPSDIVALEIDNPSNRRIRRAYAAYITRFPQTWDLSLWQRLMWYISDHCSRYTAAEMPEYGSIAYSPHSMRA